jgi:hypothetical protein
MTRLPALLAVIALTAAAAVASAPAARAQDRTDGDGWRNARDRGWSDDGHHFGRGRWDDGDRSDDRFDHRRDGDRQRPRAGASFMLRAGDTRLAVRCSPSESMRACVEAATTLMDRARAGASTPAPAQP